MGTFPDGRPKYWCDYHQKYVGHKTEDCWGKGGGKGQAGKGTTRYAPYPSKTNAVEIREIMAAALPQFAKPLLDMNIENGVMVRFERKATDNDVSTLRNLLPRLGLMYPRDNHVLVQTRDDAERDMLEKRLAKATDNGKPIHVGEIGAPRSTRPRQAGGVWVRTNTFRGKDTHEGTSSTNTTYDARRKPE